MSYPTEYQLSLGWPHAQSNGHPVFLPNDDDGQHYARYDGMERPGMGENTAMLSLYDGRWPSETTLPAPLHDSSGSLAGNYHEAIAFWPQPELPWMTPYLPSTTVYHEIATPVSTLDSPVTTPGPSAYGDAAPILHAELGPPASTDAATDHRHGGRTTSVPSHYCATCQRSFTRKFGLQDHIRRHKNLREHKCEKPGCTWRFNTKAGLRSHLQHRHCRGEQRRHIATKVQ
ncbi:hypothetical protein GGG16DRAFT_118417 [Schizophyllum commune]